MIAHLCWILRLAGLDTIVIGVTFAVLDAFDEGETLLPDLFRSFDFSFGTALLFGGQVALVILLETGLTFPLLALLLSIIATSIVAHCRGMVSSAASVAWLL